MSHFATLKVRALDDIKGATLQKAIKRLNKNFEIVMKKDFKGDLPMYGGFNAVVLNGGKPTTIQMNLEKDRETGKIGLTLGGEFYRTGFDLDTFRTKLSIAYNSVKVEDYIRKANYEPLYRNEEEDGTVVMRVRVAG